MNKSDTEQVEEASDVDIVAETIPAPPLPPKFPSLTVEEPATAVVFEAPPKPSPPVKAAEEAAAIVVVADQSSGGAHAAEYAFVRLLPPHVPAEQPGHHLHPSQHLLPQQSVDQLLKSFCFQVSSLPPYLPSLMSPTRRVRRATTPRAKPSDPLVIRKPDKWLKALQNQNIERAVWMSTPLLKRAASAGGSWCGGGWVEDVGLFVRFIDSELGFYTEPSIVYDEDSHLSDAGGTDTGPVTSILDELD